jgi:hypothetical protein
MALPVPGQEPRRLEVERGQLLSPSSGSNQWDNQRLADTIAEHLRQSGQLRHYRIDIVFQDGIARLSGTVVDQAQRDEVLRIVQGVPGVERVLDDVAVGATLTRVQAPAANSQPAQEPVLAPMPQQVPPPPAAAYRQEPMPVQQLPVPGPQDLNPPAMPPYAWPTYAPHNNYSRVAYPEAYPYQAWPFIGPCYPFPQVPLGWRSVKLEWQDGHWWFSPVATKHDWWRLRYW